MLLPLGTDRPLRGTTLVTYALIAANLAVFAWTSAHGMGEGGEEWTADLVRRFGVGGESGVTWWKLLTYAFLHGGYAHVLGNCLFLYVFGPNIEDRLGKIGFAVFYALGAMAAGGAHALWSGAPAIGASGAVAACTGAYLVMFPRTRVKVLAFFPVYGLFNVGAWWFIGGAILWDVAAPAVWRHDGIAHGAHLGGYAFGVVVSCVLLGARIVPREPFDLFTMGRQAYRRRQLKEAVLEAERRQERHWTKAKGAMDAREDEGLAAARAEVSRLIAGGDMAGAARAYRALADAYPAQGGATVLSRTQQYDLANHLKASGDDEGAAYAYERFLEAYPRDAEAAQIRLMLGLIHARSFNDPVRAKALIKEAREGLRDPAAVALAERELAALG